MMIRKFATLLALTTLAGVASALDTVASTDIVVRAPEIDPASAMAALTLLAGGLAVLRGRKTKHAVK
jgi:hypothetical protein